MRRTSITVSLAAALASAWVLGAPATAGPVPSDFHLIASAGGIPPWTENRSLEVFADGKGACFRTTPQRQGGGTTRPRRFKLSRSRLDRLVATIDQNNFFSLAPEHSSGADDGSYAFLNVTQSGNTHSVTTENIAAPDFDGIMLVLNSVVRRRACRLFYNEILP